MMMTRALEMNMNDDDHLDDDDHHHDTDLLITGYCGFQLRILQTALYTDLVSVAQKVDNANYSVPDKSLSSR